MSPSELRCKIEQRVDTLAVEIRRINSIHNSSLSSTSSVNRRNSNSLYPIVPTRYFEWVQFYWVPTGVIM